MMTGRTSTELIDEILTYPFAPIILDEVNKALEEERIRRQQFYDDITPSMKAEFINGEVIMHSPVRKAHHDAVFLLAKMLDTHVRRNKLGFVGTEKIMISLTRNDYEPDVCFFKKEKTDTFTKDQCIFPAPDLVVEVLSKSTAKNDRTTKYNDYEIHGVQEYWIIDPKKEVVEQYRLNEEGKYELILKSGEGTIECEATEGFKIDIQAIFDEDIHFEMLSKLLNTLK